MKLKAGSLFSGYGGLSLAVEQVFDAEVAWHCEFEDAPSTVLEHHWPGVPNLGDITKVDWSTVPPVDIIDGGSPCQDLSAAGRRAGMTYGTRSNLWVNMREAIAQLKPKYVVWENVRGAYSATAASEEDKHAPDCWMEQCQGCVGDGSSRRNLTALGRVLGDLSDLGYDCRWSGVRASDVGAPHGRFRVFVLATRREADPDPSSI
ncbi:DNA cytosine methyltransferase [Leucobacter albus]|uniref:DNA (cytosine-5-)-methyltransferase n=2 Tax=Actinomycetes TaxID=1760 RepID=A0ABW3TSN5_9MICO